MPRKLLTASLAFFLALFLALPMTFPALAQQATPPASNDTDVAPAVAVVQRVGPAVVTVINEQTVTGFGAVSGQVQPAGIGTGFIIDEDGHIVTNWHVVTGGEKYIVVFANGEKRDATLVGSDEISDLAVVQVEGDVPGVVSFGDSSQLQPGQPVLAIGSPLGAFSNSVTEGIISAVGRNFPIDPMQATSSSYTNLIQHDAAINPGNSGGPLLNMDGEVIGVNTLGIPSDPNGQPVQGLFFAIPSNTVKNITDELIATGSVAYPFVGVSFVPLTPTLAAQAGLDVDYGVYVADVSPDSPAEAAGIKPDDIITEMDGTKIDQDNSFSEQLFKHKPGDEVEFTIHRDGKDSTVTVTLGERPPAQQ
jgi:2-alkenal reductase